MAEIKNLTEEYVDYLRDESRSTGFADDICFAASEADIVEVLKKCFDAKIPVTVQGGRTGVAAGAVPYGGFVLNLTKMKKILSERRDGEKLFITLEPGILLTELRKEIEIKYPGYFFAPDPTETSAALGGMVSCNASGACSFMYGSTRDHVMGLKMVLMDGRTLSIKRGKHFANGYDAKYILDDSSEINVTVPHYEMPKTKKHVAGFYAKKDMDLIDLLIGCDGTLGVISEIEIELQKKPAFINTLLLFFDKQQDALEFVDDFRYKVPFLAAVEFFNHDVLDLITDRHFENFIQVPQGVTTAIYTEIQAPSEDEGFDSLGMIDEFFAKHGGREENIIVASAPSDIAKIKEFRHAAPESSNMQVDIYRKTYPELTKMGGDMSVPDDKMFEAMKMFEDTMAEGGFKSAIWAHIGNSHIHANIISRNSEEYKRAHELFKVWAANIVKMGGSVSAEHGVGKMKVDYVEIMFSQEDIDEMRKVKLAFDPEYLLSQGNVFRKI